MLASCSGCGKTSMSLTWSMIQFPPASTPWRAPEFLIFMSEMHSTPHATPWNVGNHVESTRSVTPVNEIRPPSGKGKNSREGPFIFELLDQRFLPGLELVFV